MSKYRARFFLWPELVLDVLFFSVIVWQRVWGVVAGVGFAIAVRFIVRRFGPEDALHIDAEGLHFPNLQVPWSNVARIESARPPLTWSEQIILKRPLGYPAWLSPFKISKLSLTRYEPNWRNGQIGEDIARWAPHLLANQKSARIPKALF